MGRNLSTFSKQLWSMLFVMFADRHQCFPQTCKCKWVFCSGRYIGFPVTAVIKVMRSNATLSGITGKTKLNRSFSEDGRFFSKKYSCKHTHTAFPFLNVQCTVYSTLSLLENIFVALILWRAPQINQWMGNTGHCYKSNGHNLSQGSATRGSFIPLRWLPVA